MCAAVVILFELGIVDGQQLCQLILEVVQRDLVLFFFGHNSFGILLDFIMQIQFLSKFPFDLINFIKVYNYSLFLYLVFILNFFGGREFILQLCYLVLHDLGVLDGQLLGQHFDLLIFLIEQIGFLLDNIRKSLAFKEQFFYVGSTVMVIASDLGESGSVQA